MSAVLFALAVTFVVFPGFLALLERTAESFLRSEPWRWK